MSGERAVGHEQSLPRGVGQICAGRSDAARKVCPGAGNRYPCSGAVMPTKRCRTQHIKPRGDRQAASKDFAASRKKSGRNGLLCVMSSTQIQANSRPARARVGSMTARGRNPLTLTDVGGRKVFQLKGRSEDIDGGMAFNPAGQRRAFDQKQGRERYTSPMFAIPTAHSANA